MIFLKREGWEATIKAPANLEYKIKVGQKLNFTVNPSRVKLRTVDNCSLKYNAIKAVVCNRTFFGEFYEISLTAYGDGTLLITRVSSAATLPFDGEEVFFSWIIQDTIIMKSNEILED